MGVTHEYGRISQLHFEGLVRRAWRRGANADLVLNTVPLALDIAKIITILDRQPELLDAKKSVRLSHNLGEMKMKWLHDLYDQYANLPTKEKP